MEVVQKGGLMLLKYGQRIREIQGLPKAPTDATEDVGHTLDALVGP